MGHRGENETSFDDGERSNHFCGYQNLHQQQVTTNPASKIAERETKAVMLGANPGRTLLINFDMKYIDAEKLIKAIEEKGLDCSFALKMERIDTLSLIDSLQQEQQEKKEVKFVFPKFLYARTTNNKTIDVSYAPQSMDAVEYIRSDSLQQEQPEVDLEQEISSYFKGWTETDEGIACHYQYVNLNTCHAIARHFYELGLKARKEE